MRGQPNSFLAFGCWNSVTLTVILLVSNEILLGQAHIASQTLGTCVGKGDSTFSLAGVTSAHSNAVYLPRRTSHLTAKHKSSLSAASSRTNVYPARLHTQRRKLLLQLNTCVRISGCTDCIRCT